MVALANGELTRSPAVTVTVVTTLDLFSST